MRRMRVVLSVFTILVMCSAAISVYGQSPNLVLNPSFEAYTGTPTCEYGDQGRLASLADYWTITSDGSSDFWHILYDYSECLTPVALPRTGNAHVGFVIGGNNPLYREYVQSENGIQLYHDKCYQVEFYARCTSGSITKPVGMHFSTSRIQYAYAVTPQISETKYIASGYVKISGVYTPPVDGNYYITLGAFETDPVPDSRYLFIDDVSIREITAPEVRAAYTIYPTEEDPPWSPHLFSGDQVSVGDCDSIEIFINASDDFESEIAMTLTGADIPGMSVQCVSPCSGTSPVFTGENGEVVVQINWAPSWDQCGIYPVGVTATSQCGLVSNFYFTIEVTSCLHPCCHGNGQCHLTDETTCVDEWGGEWHPEAESCEEVTCSSIPCCMPDGSCEYMFTEQECQAAGGIVPSNCDYCEPNPCEDGICCFQDGSCQAMTRCECMDASGAVAFTAGESCDPNPCSQPGVCCDFDICILTDRVCCYKCFGGRRNSWHPEWTSCDPNPCIAPCVDPPHSMIAWWPLDASDGAEGIVAYDLVGDNTLWHQGTPVANFGEHVGNSQHFENAGDYLQVPSPTDGSLDLGTADLSIDLWVRTNVTYPDVRTIVDKRGNPSGAGFSLFIGTNGSIGFQLADPSNHNNWPSSGIVSDGQWHHVAVTVDRDESNQGGKIYVDGSVVGIFDPTIRSGSLTNDGSLRIGQRNLDSGTPFQGDIDEVQIFNRELDAEEIVAIYESDVNGKCRFGSYLPPVVSMCEYNDHVHTTLIIGNFTGETKSFDVSVFGDDAIGLEAGYDPTYNSYMLGEGYTEIPVTIYPPDHFGGTESFAIMAGVTCDKGSCTSSSRVQSIPWYNCGGLSSGGDVFLVSLGLVEYVDFSFTNETAVRDTIFYAIKSLAMNGDTMRQVVSLNGLAPGEIVEGNIIVEPYDSASVSIGVSFAEYDPFVIHSLILMRDLDDDGIKENVGSYLLQSVRETAPSTAVNLTSFSAYEHDGYVEVEWTTASESNNAGFNIYRSENKEGVKVKLNGVLIPAAGNGLEETIYVFRDYGAADGEVYYYWFENVSVDGKTGMNGPAQSSRQDIPMAFSLAQNYPNPFNPVTNIKYSLPWDSRVKLTIYNVLGQRVAVLVDCSQERGYRTARWDGKNTNGADVSSGIYFYKLQAGSFEETKKMILLR
ncbi:MAG: T9SS type A sorting domain-containing protein [Bacteroidales bacterium]|nr:T9SS type A sorting domain-containing protein [Candidatus Latescibacterota bacterium]